MKISFISVIVFLATLLASAGANRDALVISLISKNDLSKMAADVREDYQWGGNIIEFSRSQKIQKNSAVSSISVSFASLDLLEREEFYRVLIEWFEDRGRQLDYKLFSTEFSSKPRSQSFVLSGEKSKVFVSVVFIGSREFSSLVTGPRESADDYILIFYEVLLPSED